jgi:hypothetical protein
MTQGHWFWFWLTALSVLWYSTITIYVTIKGYADIGRMLHELRQQRDKSHGEIKPNRDHGETR